jgi:hypothetical protein
MHGLKKYARFSIPYSRHHEKQQECLHDDYDRHRLQYDEQPSESGREIFSYSVFHAFICRYVLDQRIHHIGDHLIVQGRTITSQNQRIGVMICFRLKPFHQTRQLNTHQLNTHQLNTHQLNTHQLNTYKLNTHQPHSYHHVFRHSSSSSTTTT